MTALLDGIFGELFGGGWPEPPDTIVLRILGLPQVPTDQDTIRQAFRTRMRTAHPDVRDDVEVADANADVAELIWARDVLLRKVPEPVTASEGSAWPHVSRNGFAVTPDEVTPCNRISRHDYRCKICKDERINPYSGKPYAQLNWHGRWRGYCCACRSDAENARIRELRAQARADRTCETCGATFTPQRADGRFCSGACRQAAYRQRRRTEITA